MTNAAHALTAPPQVRASRWLEQAALAGLVGIAIALHFSIAVSQSLLAIALVAWVGLVVSQHERVDVPRFFWPLAAFGAWTLVSAAFSPRPDVSVADSKQLVLLLMVPLVYRLASGSRGHLILAVLVSAGAASAAFGIFQYGILDYDRLELRPRGTLGHYMTYSGLVMLVIGVALARVLFGTRDRLWSMLVMPALAVAVAVTFTRSAWVGACAAAALLLSLKDFRLVALLPVVAAIFFAVAPPTITARFVSIFSMNDPTNRDRAAMLRAGREMIRTHPYMGVGPAMVEPLYAEFRDPDAVEARNPHLHNVPMQIAAERGLPALGAWLAFVVVAIIDLGRAWLRGHDRVLAASGLATMVAMLTAGMFEYNFGDSEFLMMLLLVVTLPFAAARAPRADART